MNPVEVIARTLTAEAGFELLADEPVPHEMAMIAQAVLFDLGKAGVRLIVPGDVLEETADVVGGTVSVLLRAG